MREAQLGFRIFLAAWIAVSVFLGGGTVIGAALGVPETLGGSLLATSGGLVTFGVGVSRVIAGFTAPGNQISPTMSQGLNTANNAASLLGVPGAVTGGNPTAIQIGGVVSTVISLGTNMDGVLNSATIGGSATSLLGAGVDLTSIAGSIPGSVQQGPIVGPPTSINVNDTFAPLPVYSSPVSQDLSLGGIGEQTGPVAVLPTADDQWDPTGNGFIYWQNQ